MASMSIVADMTTISITEETQTELRKIKGQLMASDGKERSFDDVIMELIKHWKIRRALHEC
jgi:predicted CopG family antitoxin